MCPSQVVGQGLLAHVLITLSALRGPPSRLCVPRSLAFVVRNSHEELLVAIGDLASEGYKSLVLLHPDATGCGYGRDLHRYITGPHRACMAMP